eukprot:scaffold323279_cov19-Tisochrysis_lutea.AAC.1
MRCHHTSTLRAEHDAGMKSTLDEGTQTQGKNRRRATKAKCLVRGVEHTVCSTILRAHLVPILPRHQAGHSARAGPVHTNWWFGICVCSCAPGTTLVPSG